MTRTRTDRAAWEQANGEFLSAALDWLRLVLRAHIAGRRPSPVPTPAPASGAWRRARRPGPARPPGPDGAGVSGELIREAAEAMDRAAQTAPPPALVSLAETFALSRFERDTLLLCAAAELDPSIGHLYAQAQGNDALTHPTFALALTVLPDPAWAAVSPQRGLRFWRLVEINHRPGEALITSGLRADERIVNVVKGLNHLDELLQHYATPLEPDLEPELPDSQQAMVREVTRHWQAPGGGLPVVQLAGPDGSSKRLVAGHAAARCGLLTYRLRAALLPPHPGEVDNLARLWQRESMLLPIALYLDLEDAGQGGDARPPVRQFLDRLRCPVFLATRESWPDLGGTSVVVDVAPPTPGERAAAWRARLAAGTDESVIESLAGQFGLDTPSIAAIAAAGDDAGEVWRTCRVRTRPRLDALAQRLEPRVTWDDLVLPAEKLGILRQIADQVAHRGTVYETWGFGARITRGLGVSALFEGPSGVGKTLAAEVLAHHLDLDLYRVDLSAVVSKYIGETEKNLRRLFDAAEGGGVILLFDEADALFGKRSEVKDAHDRFANMEIAYLLQRMEAYAGLSILATNLRRALDGAFLRRLRFVVPFTFPEPSQRRAIWEKAFPRQSPRADLDYDRLAELQLTGGMARNIALNAAFLAAATGGEITMPLVLKAARDEFRKLDLPVRERDFAWTGERAR